EQALEKAGDPYDFAHELQDAGYTTDPDYANKINRIIDRYMNIDELSSLDLGSTASKLGIGG
ncbi:glucosaminidase domain-containing protein, partial [Oleiphilus sp. HI0132]|uniref:glucosaminidase domain-containing protein n=1 Tax=Oleiphilus sp. HI0132 TaxID=1822270 RepID=UPI000A54FD86